MPATWPVGVPFKLLRAGASTGEGEMAVRSGTDSGLARQRAAFTAALDNYAGNLRMTLAQYETFKAWRKGLLGGTFTWAGHPSGGSVTARFIGGEQGRPQPDPQTSKWLVPVVIEVLP